MSKKPMTQESLRKIIVGLVEESMTNNTNQAQRFDIDLDAQLPKVSVDSTDEYEDDDSDYEGNVNGVLVEIPRFMLDDSGEEGSEMAEYLVNETGLTSGKILLSASSILIKGTTAKGNDIEVTQKGEFNMYGGPSSPTMQKPTITVNGKDRFPEVSVKFADYGFLGGSDIDMNRLDVYSEVFDSEPQPVQSLKNGTEVTLSGLGFDGEEYGFDVSDEEWEFITELVESTYGTITSLETATELGEQDYEYYNVTVQIEDGDLEGMDFEPTFLVDGVTEIEFVGFSGYNLEVN
jgi:hypothetical protein